MDRDDERLADGATSTQRLEGATLELEPELEVSESAGRLPADAVTVTVA